MITLALARRVLAASAVGCAALAASPAVAENEKPSPVWVTGPTQADYDHHYPREALETRVGGYVSLRCTIAADGGLSCAVADETPGAHGFGDAALALASLMRAAPEMSDGSRSAGQEIDLELVFSVGAS